MWSNVTPAFAFTHLSLGGGEKAMAGKNVVNVTLDAPNIKAKVF